MTSVGNLEGHYRKQEVREHHDHSFEGSRRFRCLSGAVSSQLHFFITLAPSFRSETLISTLYCSMRISRSKKARRDRARAQRRREVASTLINPAVMERLSWTGVGWALINVPRGSSYVRQSKADAVKASLTRRSKTLFQHASGECIHFLTLMFIA